MSESHTKDATPQDFRATHVIQTSTRRLYVHAERREGGLIFYTRAEWGAGVKTDWEYSLEDGVTFQGKTRHDAMFNMFEPGPGTQADGWNDNGTPSPSAKFLD